MAVAGMGLGITGGALGSMAAGAIGGAVIGKKISDNFYGASETSLESSS